MNNPDISVIIVSYNVWDYLKPCLNSVLSQQGLSSEIIVVDNNSSDNSPALIQKEFPAVHLILNTDNKGFSAANNQGINAAKGKYILLLNPDTEIKQGNVLAKMCDFLDSNKDYGIAAPMLLNSDGSFQDSYWTLSCLWLFFLELFYLHRLHKKQKPDQVISVKALSGAALFFKKTLIDKTGLLDENMFWMEDIDFCYRARKAGTSVLYNPALEIIHHGGKSSANYSVVIPNQVLSKIKFYKKNGSVVQYVFVNMLGLLFIISRLCTFAMVSITGRDVFIRKRKAYIEAMKTYFRYNFKGEEAIISKRG